MNFHRCQPTKNVDGHAENFRPEKSLHVSIVHSFSSCFTLCRRTKTKPNHCRAHFCDFYVPFVTIVTLNCKENDDGAGDDNNKNNNMKKPHTHTAKDVIK